MCVCVCSVFHLTVCKLKTALFMELVSQHISNFYAHQFHSLGEPNFQLFSIAVRDQLGILTSSLNVAGVHACHTNYITLPMSASLLHDTLWLQFILST